MNGVAQGALDDRDCTANKVAQADWPGYDRFSAGSSGIQDHDDTEFEHNNIPLAIQMTDGMVIDPCNAEAFSVT